MGEDGQQVPPNRTGAEGIRNAPMSLLPIHWGDFQYYLNQQQSSTPAIGPEFPFQCPLIVNNESVNAPPPLPAVPTNMGQREHNRSPGFRKGQLPRRGRGRPPGSKNNGPRKQTTIKPHMKKVHKMVKVTNFTAPRPSFKLVANMAPPVQIPSIPQTASAFVRMGVTDPLHPTPLENQGQGSCLPDLNDHPRTNETASSSALNNVAKEPIQPITADDGSHCLAWKNDFNCGQLYDKFLELKRCKMNNLRHFQATCRIFIHHPLLLEEIDQFVSLHRNAEMPSQIASPVVNFQEGNNNVTPPFPVITLDSPEDSSVSDHSFAEPGADNPNYCSTIMQNNSSGAYSVLANLDAIVKDRLTDDPVRYRKYVCIMDNLSVFGEENSNSETSSIPNLQIKNRNMFESILGLLPNDPDLLTTVRDLWLQPGSTYPGSQRIPITNNTLGSFTHHEEIIQEEEVHDLRSEQVTATSSAQEQVNLESENTSSEFPVPCLPDLKCYESIPCESVPVSPSALILRMKDYPTLFYYFPRKLDGIEDTVPQLLDDRVDEILAEDIDEDKWKVLLLQDLAQIFVRAPHLRDPIEELLQHEVIYATKETTGTPLSVKISTPNHHNISSIPFEGSYNKYLPSMDNANYCSGRTELCNEVLNDEFHSRSSAAFFKLRRRSEEEVTLAAVEDARYEVDMRLYKIETTIAVLDRVYRRMLKMPPAELQCYEMQDLLGMEAVISKKTVEWFYKGERVMLGLRGFPTLFVPRVLETLKGVNMEWIKMRSKWNDIFSEDIEK